MTDPSEKSGQDRRAGQRGWQSHGLSQPHSSKPHARLVQIANHPPLAAAELFPPQGGHSKVVLLCSGVSALDKEPQAAETCSPSAFCL